METNNMSNKKINEILQNNLIPKTLEQAKLRKYNFWDKQPVPRINDNISKENFIKKIKFDELNYNPIKLPDDFKWVTYNIDNDDDCNKISNFLEKYYLEDEVNFKLIYSKNFLKWYFKKPDKFDETDKSSNKQELLNEQNLLIGVEVARNSTLVGFISGIPIKYQLNKNILDVIDVNFLCVHPKLRNKKLSPVIISELIRRSKLLKYSQGFFSTERYIPKPFHTTNYYQRALNAEKLIKSKFLKITEKNISLKSIIKYYKLPNKPSTNKFVKMEKKHLNEAYDKLNIYFQKYNFYPVYSLEEFKCLFFDNDIVTCYVLEDENGVVLDFISYYKINYKILNNSYGNKNSNNKYKFIKSANLFYYTSTVETSYRLIKDILIIAKKEGLDIFNATDNMENKSILEELEFRKSKKSVHYNLYNWRARDLSCNQIGKTII